MSFTSPEKGKLFLRSWLQGREAWMALEAMKVCIKNHNGLRKDGVTPEWFHQVSIALYLITLNGLEDIIDDLITVVFLHDIVEDKGYSLETIREKWGIPVANGVRLLTKKTPTSPALNSEVYYRTMDGSPLAALTKGADRINNFQTMPKVFSEQKQADYMTEAKVYLLPMLKRAREKYPKYRLAFENLKHMLSMQMLLVKLSIEN